jgi:peptidoglycan/LPS O-acetylase OafA/YrhL
MGSVAPAATYITNILNAVTTHPNVLAHMWSLALEAQFYAVWPLVLPAILKHSQPRLTLALMWLVLTVARAASGWQVGYHLHSSGLVLGALMTFLPRASTWAAWPALAAIFAVVVTADKSPLGLSLGISGAEVAAAALIASTMRPSVVTAALSSGPFAYVGQLSYAIYLWHYPILYVVWWYLLRWYWAAPVVLLLSILAAVVSRYAVELPAQRGVRTRRRAAPQPVLEGRVVTDRLEVGAKTGDPSGEKGQGPQRTRRMSATMQDRSL